MYKPRSKKVRPYKPPVVKRRKGQYPEQPERVVEVPIKELTGREFHLGKDNDQHPEETDKP
jgi:hypothetical protein